MKPLSVRKADCDDDPTILTPEEEEEDLRDIREAKADVEKHGAISHEDLMAELGL
ncbi:MAG: hypothetical protein ABIH23_03575 [bacterium]